MPSLRRGSSDGSLNNTKEKPMSEKKSYFPIAIAREGDKSLSLINHPEDLPIGAAFRIILTEVTPDQFRIAEAVYKQVAKDLWQSAT